MGECRKLAPHSDTPVPSIPLTPKDPFICTKNDSLFSPTLNFLLVKMHFTSHSYHDSSLEWYSAFEFPRRWPNWPSSDSLHLARDCNAEQKGSEIMGYTEMMYTLQLLLLYIALLRYPSRPDSSTNIVHPTSSKTLDECH